jgi:acyl carrier protein
MENQERIEKELLDFVRQNIVAPDVNIEADTVLVDIGVDSYSVIEMVLFIERCFGVSLPEEKLLPANLKSVEALARCTAELME